MREIVAQALLLLPSVVVALTIHEYAHAWVATRLGDPTPKMAGRLTLNPIAHIDILGFLALLLVKFGWAKPVPVNPLYFRNPRRDMALVAMAGPGSNLGLALLMAGALRLVPRLPDAVFLILYLGVFINLVLFLFNLIPLYPLDGWRIVAFLRPSLGSDPRWMRAGPLLLLGLIALGIFLPGGGPLGWFLNLVVGSLSRFLVGV